MVKLADNTDSFTCVSHEETYTRDTQRERFLPLSLRNSGTEQILGERGWNPRTKREKRRKKDEGQECVSMCVWARLSITLSWDSLLTPQACRSSQNRRLGPAGNWWSKLCHPDHISRPHLHTNAFFPLETRRSLLIVAATFRGFQVSGVKSI